MKLSEFEEKLTTVSDDKLRLMLANSREKGPEVAVNLILAEGRRRGMNLEDGAPAPAGFSDGGFSRADAPGADALSESGTPPEQGAPPESSGDDPAFSGEAGPAGTKGAWLLEEANQGLPLIVKILIAIVVLGGLGAFLFIFLNGR